MGPTTLWELMIWNDPPEQPTIWTDAYDMAYGFSDMATLSLGYWCRYWAGYDAQITDNWAWGGGVAIPLIVGSAGTFVLPSGIGAPVVVSGIPWLGSITLLPGIPALAALVPGAATTTIWGWPALPWFVTPAVPATLNTGAVPGEILGPNLLKPPGLPPEGVAPFKLGPFWQNGPPGPFPPGGGPPMGFPL